MTALNHSFGYTASLFLSLYELSYLAQTVLRLTELGRAEDGIRRGKSVPLFGKGCQDSCSKITQQMVLS